MWPQDERFIEWVPWCRTTTHSQTLFIPQPLYGNLDVKYQGYIFTDFPEMGPKYLIYHSEGVLTQDKQTDLGKARNFQVVSVGVSLFSCGYSAAG